MAVVASQEAVAGIWLWLERHKLELAKQFAVVALQVAAHKSQMVQLHGVPVWIRIVY